jgi:hypothetical protein
MNDDDFIPEEMPQEHGGNILQSEKQVGAEALKLIRRYESLLNKHDKIIVKSTPPSSSSVASCRLVSTSTVRAGSLATGSSAATSTPASSADTRPSALPA